MKNGKLLERHSFSKIPTVVEYPDLLDVQRQMARLRVRALPVVEYGRLLGIITYRQIQDFIQAATSWSQNDQPRIASI